MSQKYKAIEGSQTAHCCFVATVINTTKKHSIFKHLYDPICECFDMSDAETIADALNYKMKGESDE